MDEGKVSHSFLENQHLDELPEGRGQVQPASPGALSRMGCSGHTNYHWKRGGDLQAHPGCGTPFRAVLPLSSAQFYAPWEPGLVSEVRGSGTLC